MDQNNKILSVVLPALNEEQHIASVLKKIPAHIKGIHSILVIVVDDGSSDKTVEIARACGAHVISHPRNYGVGRAFQTGVAVSLESGADIMVTLDSDGQFDPGEIAKLIEPIQSNQADCVIADRFLSENGGLRRHPLMPWKTFYGNRIVTFIINLVSGKHFHDVSSGFRAYSREALLRLNISRSFDHVQESLLDLVYKGMVVKSVPITVSYLPGRVSRVAYNLFSYGWNVLKLVVRVFKDYKPFVFFFSLSLPFFLTTLLCFVFYLREINMGRDGRGLITIGIGAAVILFILWLIGVVSDMLVRIRMNQENIIYMLKKQQYEKQ